MTSFRFQGTVSVGSPTPIPHPPLLSAHNSHLRIWPRVTRFFTPKKPGSNISGQQRNWASQLELFHKHQADEKASSPRGHIPLPQKRRKRLGRERHTQVSCHFWSLEKILTVPPSPHLRPHDHINHWFTDILRWVQTSKTLHIPKKPVPPS